MKTAVISCGPSCALFDERKAEYDLVIGVNWIATRYLCNWVCVHDRSMMGIEEPDQPGIHQALWSPTGERRVLGRPFWFLHWYAYDELRLNRPDIWQWLSDEFVMLWPKAHKDIPYTGLAPLYLLWILGIDNADLYGYDMTGNLDGRANEHPTRTDERWQRETNIFQELVRRFDLNLTLMRE